MNTKKNTREVKKIIKGTPTFDGDGVSLTRVIGSPQLNMLDPFLLLDEFGSDQPLDYIGGFPSHPHRGFETVTYMLVGKMRHKDSAGNAGVIESGGVQWMTAGKGIIHSEMPEQTDGLLAGLQLWVNLPAAKKMDNPKYQEHTKQEVPLELRENGTLVKVIAGKTKLNTQGVIINKDINPTYWDVTLAKNVSFVDQIEAKHNAFIYMLEGSLDVGNDAEKLNKGQLAVLTKGEGVLIKANKKSRFILVAGKPLNEPVARGGPFVMNTKQQILDAFADYKNGTLA
jgi:redox-sensitive bicupin YhaK (pirin superfamily)